jgi:hypothetical protein
MDVPLFSRLLAVRDRFFCGLRGASEISARVTVASDRIQCQPGGNARCDHGAFMGRKWIILLVVASLRRCTAGLDKKSRKQPHAK